MTSPDFTTTITVDNTPSDAFNAINNIGEWWEGVIEGNTKELNDEFTYRMKEFHFSKQKIVEFVPNEKVVWLVTESSLSFIEQHGEWTGTTISFDITTINNKAQIRFTHHGLVPQIECFGACSNAWGRLIQESLYSLITTGKGKEIF